MAGDSESCIQYLQTPTNRILETKEQKPEQNNYKKDIYDLKEDVHFKKKHIRDNRLIKNKEYTMRSKEVKSSISGISGNSRYSPFMQGIIDKKNEVMKEKDKELMSKITNKYKYISYWIESSNIQGKCILPVMFDKADFHVNYPGLGAPIEVLKRWLKNITEKTHYLFGIKYSILFIDNRKCRYMKPYFLVNFRWS